MGGAEELLRRTELFHQVRDGISSLTVSNSDVVSIIILSVLFTFQDVVMAMVTREASRSRRDGAIGGAWGDPVRYS